MSKFIREYGKTKLQQFTKSKLQPHMDLKRDIYEVTLVHMHGDADHYTTDINDFKYENDMLDFVNFILRCMVAFPNGMSDDDCFNNVEGYEKYSDCLFINNEYYGGEAPIDTMDIVFYDSDNVKWDVELLE